MGFMDKLKDAGKSALKGALIAAAHSYGTVTDGKYKLCKVSMNSAFDKLTFIKVAAIEAEHVIKEDITTFYLDSENDSSGQHYIKIEFNDGETSKILLNVEKDQGSALPTAGQRIAAQYSKVADLVAGLAKNVPQLSEETRNWANKIMRYAGKKEI